MESLHDVSRRLSPLLSERGQALYFADVLEHLSKFVPHMCKTNDSSPYMPSSWRARSFFRLQLAPPPTTQPETRSSWVRRALSKNHPASAQGSYVVSYFGEPFHAARPIPPGGSSFDRVVKSTIVPSSRRGLPPDQAAFVELMTHWTYSFICVSIVEPKLAEVWDLRASFLKHYPHLNQYLGDLVEDLKESGFSAKTPTTTLDPQHQTMRRFGIGPMPSHILSDPPEKPSSPIQRLERPLSAFFESRSSFQSSRTGTDFERSAETWIGTTGRPLSWGPTVAPQTGGFI